METAASVLQVDWRAMTTAAELSAFAARIEVATARASDAATHAEKLSLLAESVLKKKGALELCDSLQHSMSSFTDFETSVDTWADDQPERLHAALEGVLASLREVERRADQMPSNEMIPQELLLALGHSENSNPELYVRRELLAADTAAALEDTQRRKASKIATLLLADRQREQGGDGK